MSIIAIALGWGRALVGFLIGSEVGRLILVGVVALSYGYYKGDQHGDRQCAAAAARVELARKKVEASLQRSQEQSTRAVVAELAAQKKDAEEKLRELQNRIKSKPGAVYDSDCRVVDPSGSVRQPAGPRP